MSGGSTTLRTIAEFVAHAEPPALARQRASAAFLDTIGVMLAGASEPASERVQTVLATEYPGRCRVLGTSLTASASGAALANGTAAHALDFDDMCFVSLAHPSAPLVAALLAAGETARATGRLLADAYAIGFEIEGRLGPLMNPEHYQRGWHCTSTLGTIGAAAAVSRALKLPPETIAHAIAIAASEACGLKENFGTMVKPLHAGLAARNAILAARLAQSGMTASAHAIDGDQGFVAAFAGTSRDAPQGFADLGSRWELIESGITVKLYPSCAGTHPALDAMLDVRREHGLTPDDVRRVVVDVDAITPTILIYNRPATGLEGKFSMPFCLAAAIVDGRVDVGTFDDARMTDPKIRAVMERVTMGVSMTLDTTKPPLTQARIHVELRDGRTITREADGARGYPERPASEAELDDKFLSCAERALGSDAARQALDLLRRFESLEDVTALLAVLSR
jgi:2-methylcitrate dehydratase PrpD